METASHLMFVFAILDGLELVVIMVCLLLLF